MLDRKGQFAHRRTIADLLHGTVVPDLLSKVAQTHSNSGSQMPGSCKFEFHGSDVTALSHHLLGGESFEAEKLVTSYKEAGCTASDIVLNLLSDTARHLGDRWCADSLSFADVTLGVSGLHSMLHMLDRDLQQELTPGQFDRSILLATVPQDTHIFAISVLETFFRNSGWFVEAILDSQEQLLMRRISEFQFDAFGLSIACRNDLSKAKSLISRLRSKSANEDLKILVGGGAIGSDQDLAGEIGADGVAENAVQAVEIAARICQLNKSRESVSCHV